MKAFRVPGSMFRVLCSVFRVPCSVFGVLCSGADEGLVNKRDLSIRYLCSILKFEPTNVLTCGIVGSNGRGKVNPTVYFLIHPIKG